MVIFCYLGYFGPLRAPEGPFTGPYLEYFHIPSSIIKYLSNDTKTKFFFPTRLETMIKKSKQLFPYFHHREGFKDKQTNENITAKNISRRFTGIQHTILGWNDKELDDDLFVYVYPIHYESCIKETREIDRKVVLIRV